MITKEKIMIYVSYFGDMDGWGRAGRSKEKIMEDKDWYVLRGIIQDLVIINKGLASDDYVQNVEEKLRVEFDSEETIKILKDLAKHSDE